MVEGLRRICDTHLPRLPRMADFAIWASACETAFWPRGTFWAAYEGNRAEAVENVIEADPVAMAVRALMGERAEWVGTATALLPLLADRTGRRVVEGKAWPESPRALSGQLRRAATILRKTGIELVFLKSKGKSPARLIRITARTVVPTSEDGGPPPSEPSEPSAPEEKINDYDGFEPLERRTVGAGSAGGTVGALPTVRHNPLEIHRSDASDGSDAKLPVSSTRRQEAAPERWSGRS